MSSSNKMSNYYSRPRQTVLDSQGRCNNCGSSKFKQFDNTEKCFYCQSIVIGQYVHSPYLPITTKPNYRFTDEEVDIETLHGVRRESSFVDIGSSFFQKIIKKL